MKKRFEILLFFIFSFTFSGSLYANTINKILINNSSSDSRINVEINDNLNSENWQNTSINYSVAEKMANGFSTDSVAKNDLFTVSSYSSSISIENVNEVFLKVFPNPATEKLFIQFNGWGGVKEITLLDITGRSVFMRKSVDDNYEVDISSLPKGIYLISAKNESNHVVKKIKIQ